MLVLSRRIGEELVIGDDIRVRVVKSSGNRVTLGIDAPPHVQIHRQELLEQLAAAQNVLEFRDLQPERKSA